MSGQDNREEMAGFVDEFGLDGFDHVADLQGQLWAAFGITAQPSYVFINDDGAVTRSAGGMRADEFTEQVQLLIDS